jgi:hypothetical protein
MSTQADAQQTKRTGGARNSPAAPDLTVEGMFRGLPAVGLDDPWRRPAALEGHGIAPQLPSAMLAAIRHHG